MQGLDLPTDKSLVAAGSSQPAAGKTRRASQEAMATTERLLLETQIDTLKKELAQITERLGDQIKQLELSNRLLAAQLQAEQQKSQRLEDHITALETNIDASADRRALLDRRESDLSEREAEVRTLLQVFANTLFQLQGYKGPLTTPTGEGYIKEVLSELASDGMLPSAKVHDGKGGENSIVWRENLSSVASAASASSVSAASTSSSAKASAEGFGHRH